MSPLSSFAVLALPALTLAQGWGAAAPSAPASSTEVAAAAASTGTSSSVQQVMVGAGGNFVFSPSSITAKMGDQIEFMFPSNNIHSVAQGTAADPCSPSSATAFYSGFPKGGGAPFTLTVNSTDPIYFYCAAPTHCQMGMVGVINPGPTSQKELAAAAGKTSTSKTPSQVQGGVFAAASSGSSSSSTSSGASGSSSASASSSASMAPTSAASGNMALTFAGIAIPLVAAAWAML